MTDAQAREYGILALEGFARELEGALVQQREVDAVDLIERIRTAAGRLDRERVDDRVDVLAEGLDTVVQVVKELEQRVGYLSRRVLGGVPRTGVVVADGPSPAMLSHIAGNIERVRAGEQPLPMPWSLRMAEAASSLAGAIPYPG